MLEQLHQVLLGCGFCYTKAQHIPSNSMLRAHNQNMSGFYVKDYITASGVFKIALSFKGDPHIELPWAYVLASPEQYKNRLLPHINYGWYLCYVQEMEADWDPNDIKGTYLQIDYQIQLTLDRVVVSVTGGDQDHREIEGEFSAYWRPTETAYLLSDATELKLLECCVAVNNLKGASEYEEWVIYHKNHVDETVEWLIQRGLKRRDDKSFITRYVRLKPSSMTGMVWPPKNFKELLQWIADVDHQALMSVIQHFIEYPVKRHLLLLDIHQQDVVGVYVEINIQALALNSYRSSRKNKIRSIKHNDLRACLSGKNTVHKFCRVDVIKADRKSVLSRNRSRPDVGDLGGKRIALIGCGTIGGYLSHLLLRAGAGCGSGYFHLFDHDDIQPHNFARHSLTTAEFGQNKATAVANTLKFSTHLAKNIVGFPKRFVIDVDTLTRYDIVIDATGRPPISKRLAKVIRSISLPKRPFMVHGFNDGNGRASKVLIDNGQCCYGCMLADPAFYHGGLDLRFKHLDQHAEKIIGCGSTYTPYDAAVSVITASMMQEAVLYALEPKILWNYSEHMLDGSRSRQARQLNCHQKCEICHGRNGTDI